MVFFTRQHFEQMGEATDSGSDSAEPQDDRIIEIEFAHLLGDRLTLEAERARVCNNLLAATDKTL